MQADTAQENGTGGSGAPPRRSRMPLWPLAIFAIVVVLFALALRSGDPSKLPSALIGRPAPAITLPALDGLSDGVRPVGGFASADLANGHVSVVNFWASWCDPCVDEHPMLMALKERTGVRLYGINYKDQAATARRFLGRYGNPFVAVGVDTSGRAAIEWGVTGMPETFIINGKGEIVYKHIGPISAETLETKIIPMLRAAAAAR
jgi:cytochrome c biogenesis protein CcmG/thiol:disulfide interchange protein DsbE